MNEQQIEVLNIVQEVLRGAIIALAVANKSNLGDLSRALHAAAANGALDPASAHMLADLAMGAHVMHSGGIRKQ